MRISTEQDALRHPLNEVLGTEANVRLLRVLAHEVEAPLSAPDAAERSGLTVVGARKALRRLLQSGFVVRIGGGRTHQYGLKENEPLISALKALFQEEESRYDALLRHLREALLDIRELRSAWIPDMPAKPGDALEISVVAEAKSLPWIREELRARLSPLEGQFDQVIEIATFTLADAPDPAPNALSLVAGTLPERDRARSEPASHFDRDERALRMSRAIAELIRSDPSMIKRAIRHLDRLVHEGQGTATADLVEWRQILETYSPQRVQGFLVSTSSRAIRLRQSSPFFAILTADERDTLMANLEAER